MAAIAAVAGLQGCTAGWLDVDTSPFDYYDYYNPVVVPPPGYYPLLSDPLYGPVYRPGFGPVYHPGFGPGMPPPIVRPPHDNGGVNRPSGPNIGGGGSSNRPGQAGNRPTVNGQRPGSGSTVKPGNGGWGTGTGTGNGGNTNGGLNGQRRGSNTR